MKISSVVHRIFHWSGMLAAVGILAIMPWSWVRQVSHGQTMAGAMGVAMAPAILWFLVAVVVVVATIVSCIAAFVSKEPPETRKPCWLPFVVGMVTSGIFWGVFLLSL